MRWIKRGQCEIEWGGKRSLFPLYIQICKENASEVVGQCLGVVLTDRQLGSKFQASVQKIHFFVHIDACLVLSANCVAIDAHAFCETSCSFGRLLTWCLGMFDQCFSQSWYSNIHQIHPGYAWILFGMGFLIAEIKNEFNLRILVGQVYLKHLFPGGVYVCYEFDQLFWRLLFAWVLPVFIKRSVLKL